MQNAKWAVERFDMIFIRPSFCASHPRILGRAKRRSVFRLWVHKQAWRLNRLIQLVLVRRMIVTLPNGRVWRALRYTAVVPFLTQRLSPPQRFQWALRGAYRIEPLCGRRAGGDGESRKRTICQKSVEKVLNWTKKC